MFWRFQIDFDNVKISVGITAYKNSKYLIEALNSLINQSIDTGNVYLFLIKALIRKLRKFLISLIIQNFKT